MNKFIVVKPSDYKKITAHRLTIHTLDVKLADVQLENWSTSIYETAIRMDIQINKAKRFIFTNKRWVSLLCWYRHSKVCSQERTELLQLLVLLSLILAATLRVIMSNKLSIISLLKKHYGQICKKNPDLSFLKEPLDQNKTTLLSMTLRVAAPASTHPILVFHFKCLVHISCHQNKSFHFFIILSIYNKSFHFWWFH